jgi:hypothetical protein
VQHAIVAIVVLASLIAAGSWASVRAARFAGVAALPGSCRRRLQWWQDNAGHIQLACTIAVAVAIGTELVIALH